MLVEIPHAVPELGWRSRLRLRTRVFGLLRLTGVPAATLRRLRLCPLMTMDALSESQVRHVFGEAPPRSSCGSQLHRCGWRGLPAVPGYRP